MLNRISSSSCLRHSSYLFGSVLVILPYGLCFPKCWIPGRGFWILYLAFAGFLPWIFIPTLVLDPVSGLSCLMKKSPWGRPPAWPLSMVHPGVLDVLSQGPEVAWEGLVFAFSELDMWWIHLALASWTTPPPASFLTRWHAWSQLLSPCLGFPRKNLYSQWFAFWILTIAPFLLLHVASF